MEAEIKKLPHLIGLCYRIATEDVVLQDPGKRPVHTAIGSITPAALPEVGGNIIELPPDDCHLVSICWVNGNRTFVSSVAEYILAVLIDIRLITDEPVIH